MYLLCFSPSSRYLLIGRFPPPPSWGTLNNAEQGTNISSILAPRHVRSLSPSLLSPIELDNLQGKNVVEDNSSSLDEHSSATQERQPLLHQYPEFTTSPPRPKSRAFHPQSAFSTTPRTSKQRSWVRIAFDMEKLRDSKVSRFLDKVAVDSEPGLTNAQLMLTNFDLKPGW